MTDGKYATDMLPRESVDAVVIVGGAAGLSGALMLARSRRSVVVIDSLLTAAESMPTAT